MIWDGDELAIRRDLMNGSMHLSIELESKEFKVKRALDIKAGGV